MSNPISLGAAPPATGVSSEQVRAPYIRYNVAINYPYDAGVLQLPVAYTQGQAAPQNPSQLSYTQRQACAQIQVAAPMGQKIVTFDLARLGAPCVAPDPTPTNPNETLMSAVITPIAPIIDANGGASLYQMTGTYIYSLAKPY